MFGIANEVLIFRCHEDKAKLNGELQDFLGTLWRPSWGSGRTEKARKIVRILLWGEELCGFFRVKELATSQDKETKT